MVMAEFLNQLAAVVLKFAAAVLLLVAAQVLSRDGWPNPVSVGSIIGVMNSGGEGETEAAAALRELLSQYREPSKP